jgi:hypothetical protein
MLDEDDYHLLSIIIWFLIAVCFCIAIWAILT